MKSKSEFKIIKFNKEAHLDLIEPLTDLLHEAYAPLALKGMRYLATHQSASKTLERLEEGESYLAFYDDELAGTVTLRKERIESACEHYKKAGVYSFGQFAIKPKFQSFGFGSLMMNMIEERAKELGAIELALDTSEQADNLIAMYEKRGYRHVAYVQWDITNYRSVILSKNLKNSAE